MRASAAIGILLLLVLAAPPLAAGPGAAVSPPALRSPSTSSNASYTLAATLDATNHLIVGRGRLTWRNPSAAPATELRFHMDWNAWRDEASTWMRETRLAGSARIARAADDRGFIDLTTLTVAGDAGSEDLLPRARYIAPDDENADDRTVLSVPLDHPVAAGQTIAIDLAWNAHVPRPYARAGVVGRNFVIADWFPKIGVLEDAGWNCHQRHVTDGAFSDFGDYDVTLTIPGGWIVGATGVETSHVDNGNGTTSHRFVARDVDDFAWTTDPGYVERHARVDQAGQPGAAGASAIDVRLLLQPEHVTQADRYFHAVQTALAAYRAWSGPYPYGTLTVVDPVTILEPDVQGANLGGLAFPMLITAGTRWIARPKDASLETAIARGVARQFFSAAIGSDDVEHAWMGRGLTAYAASTVIAAAPKDTFADVERYFDGIAPWTYDDAAWSAIENGGGLDRLRTGAPWSALSDPSWRDWPGDASTAEARAALALTALERVIGKSAMQRALATYVVGNAGRHPAPDAFFQAVNAAAGRDLTWFFDQTFRRAATFDYAVAAVANDATGTGAIDSRVVLRRLGDGIFPVDVRVTFADGASVTERWDGVDRAHDLRYRRGARVTRIEIDPDRVLTLDVDETNNSWTDRPETRAAAYKWALHWLNWFEHTLLTYAFFA